MYIVILVLFLAGTVFCQTSNVWRGIEPLKSTREDVEEILGKPEPTSTARHAARYKTSEGKVFVLYSTGLCDVDPRHGWDIPELTVIRISFYPDDPSSQKFSSLKIDSSKFDRSPDPGAIHSVFYTNKVDGIVLTVDTIDNSISSFGYFPKSEYDHLRCK